MIFKKMGRTFVFALILGLAPFASAIAHSLPHSVLIFGEAQDRLTLRLEIALEDLVIAEPKFADLTKLPVNQTVPENTRTALNAYFVKHLEISFSGAPIPMQIQTSALQSAQNDHVGVFTILVVEMHSMASLSDDSPTLMLRYDAVMHEVRNHRAIVYWQAANSEPSGLAEFGYSQTDAKVPLTMLRHP